MKASCYYHLNEIPKPHSRIRTIDYCFYAVQGIKRKTFLLRIPVFPIQKDLYYYIHIIFN